MVDVRLLSNEDNKYGGYQLNYGIADVSFLHLVQLLYVGKRVEGRF